MTQQFISLAKLHCRDETKKSQPLLKDRLFEKEALGYITRMKSKFFGGLLFTYGMLCLECQNTFFILL